MPDRKVIEETHVISGKKGNGVLRREVWVNTRNEVTRYNLAYINHQILNEDNGRVLGFDNAHGYHHRHYYGKVESISFTCFEDIEMLFEQAWLALRNK